MQPQRQTNRNTCVRLCSNSSRNCRVMVAAKSLWTRYRWVDDVIPVGTPPSSGWIEKDDQQEMGRDRWLDTRAPLLVESLARQRAKLDAIQKEKDAVEEKRQQDRGVRSNRALLFGAIAAVLTLPGVFGSPALFGEKLWLALYALCFLGIPICAGLAGAMFYTLRRAAARPPSVGEAQAHGFWAGLGSAVLFFVSQVTSNREITSLYKAVSDGVGGLDILLLFSLVIAFVAGLTYEAVFGKWEAVDASRAAVIETGGK